MTLLSLCLAATLAVPGQWNDPVERLEPPADLEPLIERLGARERAVWLDDDRLTFLLRSRAENVGLTTMIDVPFVEVDDGLHLGQVRLPDIDQLILSYSFTKEDENGWDQLSSFRGASAPPIPEACLPLAGRHLYYSLESEYLSEPRTVEVYVPAGNETGLPVVYMADGSALEEYVGSIDWAIRQGRLAPMVLVGVHNGGYGGDRDAEYDPELDWRAKEYLEAVGDERYLNHLLFLLEDVLPFVEARHGVSDEPSKRVLSGYSNGGAFALTAGAGEPSVFGHVLAYSVAFFDRDALRERVEGAELPSFSFAGGELEWFIEGTRDAAAILEESGADVRLRSYIAGHDPLLWRIALHEDLARLFPGQR